MSDTQKVEKSQRTKIIADRLDELSIAVANGDRSELTMRIPAEPDRDADLILSEAAKLLRAANEEIERLKRERDEALNALRACVDYMRDFDSEEPILCVNRARAIIDKVKE